MNDPFSYPAQLPAEQQAIRAKCFHSSGTFVEFPIADVEASIPEWFETRQLEQTGRKERVGETI